MSPDQGFIRGKWNKIDIKNRKKIIASYDKIKDWVMDPKGYFLIEIDKNKNLLRVGYCKIIKNGNSTTHEMVAEVEGETAIKIINTSLTNKIEGVTIYKSKDLFN